MIAKVHSAIPYGYEGRLIEVEGDSSRGLPAFNIVGMAAKTINEARERVRSALMNSDFAFPNRKITVNLAPAELPKDGAHLDLPIAVSILILSKQLLQSDVKDCLFAGELSLSSKIRPVHGIINIVETAKSAGFTTVYLPWDNLAQATLIPGVTVIGVKNLQDLLLHLKNQPSTSDISEQQNYHPRTNNLYTSSSKIPASTNTAYSSNLENVVKNTKTEVNSPTPATSPSPLLDHIRGQTLAKRALQIAIAGHHNILISGPPGSGKTILARAGANLLPDPSPDEQIAITKIHSLAGLTDDIVTTRPFRTPHHTASRISIIGGGAHATPGEISLAHLGVLFLDELPEYPRSTLEALRQPLEDHQITISRIGHKSTYPADFMLIATMNPCPCGYLGDPTHECTCTLQQIESYRKKLSGPLLDRIDLVINVKKVDNSDLLSFVNPPAPASSSTPPSGSSSTPPPNSPDAPPLNPPDPSSPPPPSHHTVVKNTITEALARQRLRYHSSTTYNSSLSSHQVSTLLHLTPAARRLLTAASNKLDLSARAYFKVIKVARTIADLDALPDPVPITSSAPSAPIPRDAPQSTPNPTSHNPSHPSNPPPAPPRIDEPHIAEALSLRHQLL